MFVPVRYRSDRSDWDFTTLKVLVYKSRNSRVPSLNAINQTLFSELVCNVRFAIFFVPNFVRITDSKVDNLFYRLTRFTFDHEYIHSKVKSNIISAKIENRSIYTRDALTVRNGPVRDKQFLVNFWFENF